LEKDRYQIRKCFAAEEGNVLIVADYGQLEVTIDVVQFVVVVVGLHTFFVVAFACTHVWMQINDRCICKHIMFCFFVSVEFVEEKCIYDVGDWWRFSFTYSDRHVSRHCQGSRSWYIIRSIVFDLSSLFNFVVVVVVVVVVVDRQTIVGVGFERGRAAGAAAEGQVLDGASSR
jgi:hypothetical protein